MLHIVPRRDTPQQAMPPGLPSAWKMFHHPLNDLPGASALAERLGRFHARYEGWQAPTSFGPNFLSLYRKVMAIAVRLCSAPDRQCAMSAAHIWAESRFDALQREMASPDATEAVRAQLIDGFVSTVIDIHLHCLEHGVSGPKHVAYQSMLDAGFASEEPAS